MPQKLTQYYKVKCQKYQCFVNVLCKSSRVEMVVIAFRNAYYSFKFDTFRIYLYKCTLPSKSPPPPPPTLHYFYSGTPKKVHFSTAQLTRPLTGSETHETKTWQFPLNEIAVKVTKCTKIHNKTLQFLQIWSLFPIFEVSLLLCVFTSKVVVEKSHHNISQKSF